MPMSSSVCKTTNFKVQGWRFKSRKAQIFFFLNQTNQINHTKLLIPLGIIPLGIMGQKSCRTCDEAAHCVRQLT